jgi:protein-disulfide isomerase
VEQAVALGKDVGVTGTPTLFINGRGTNLGIPVEVLKRIVDFAAVEK